MNVKVSAEQTVSLIGMPGVGKSTVGVVLAKFMSKAFLDSDLEIQQREGMTLQQILESEDFLQLRRIEEEVLLQLPLSNCVLATGGSAVYSVPVMQRLREAGPVVYLRAPLEMVQTRVQAHPHRGIASDPAESYAAIYAERTPLYERYANITVDVDACSVEAIVESIAAALAQ